MIGKVAEDAVSYDVEHNAAPQLIKLTKHHPARVTYSPVPWCMKSSETVRSTMRPYSSRPRR